MAHQHENQKKSENKVEAVAEQPKTKMGDKAESPKAAVSTTVDGAAPAKERKPRKTTPKDGTYRILDGVDAAKFVGQRGSVIRSLQKLASQKGASASHTLSDIVANVEGLVSRTPVEDSVRYHLKGLVDNGQVVLTPPPAAETKEQAAA